MDKDLIDKFKKGDKAAFEEIYISYYAPLCEYASHFVDGCDVEELVSDLMLYLWESRDKLEIHTSLKSYLFVAVKYRCFTLLEQNKRRAKTHSEIYYALQDQFDNPDYYMSKQLASEIEKAIEELPDTYRETFKLSRFGEQTNAEVARHQNLSVKTIEYRISQALKFLVKRLKDYLVMLLLFV